MKTVIIQSREIVLTRVDKNTPYAGEFTVPDNVTDARLEAYAKGDDTTAMAHLVTIAIGDADVPSS